MNIVTDLEGPEEIIESALWMMYGAATHHLLAVLLRAVCILCIHIFSYLCVYWVLFPQIQIDIGWVVGVVGTILQRNKLGNFTAPGIVPRLCKESRKKNTRPYKMLLYEFDSKISGKIRQNLIIILGISPESVHSASTLKTVEFIVASTYTVCKFVNANVKWYIINSLILI